MPSKQITSIKGFNDALPGHPEAFLHADRWQRAMATMGDVLRRFGYSPVYLSLLEETELFVRGLGEQTDVVSKEMYTLTDRGDRRLTLRPEGTAGAVRAYVQHHYARNEPQQRWSYLGPMFRAERPQKGRYRQFYQLGAECFGHAGPGVDVEILSLLVALCDALDLGPMVVRVNTLGDAASRARYLGVLGAFFTERRDELCATCQVRADKNPLRVLDCKQAGCQALLAQAPDIADSLSVASREWFASYLGLIEACGIEVVRDRRLVRGLDYYSEAIFELTTAGLGAQDAVFGGGRYDSLVESLGGPSTPAVGFAGGIERILLLQQARAAGSAAPAFDLVLAALDPQSTPAVLQLAQNLRAQGVTVVTQPEPSKLKQALKHAYRQRAACFVALGAKERDADRVELKWLDGGRSEEVALAELARAIKQA